MDDYISRQAVIDAINSMFSPTPTQMDMKEDCLEIIENLPSVQPETCDTCKHGYFGDEQCKDCRVRFTSHYERRTDD